MGCAVLQISWPKLGIPTAQCPRCRSTTEVDHAVAQQICDVPAASVARPTSRASPAGGTDYRSRPGSPRQYTEPIMEVPPNSKSGPQAPPTSTVNPVASTATFAPVQQSAHPIPTATFPLCGQCQAFPAELHCEQCDEQFCSDCSSAMHRAGRMRGHHLSRLEKFLERTIPNGVERPRTDGSQTARSNSVPGSPKPLFCSDHPEEPLQFFCLDCEVEPICAECVVHVGAPHFGHKVLKLNAALQRLCAEELPRLESLARERVEHNAQLGQKAVALRRDLSLTISQGRQRLQEAFVRMRASLGQKESQLLAGVEEVARVADVALSTRATQVEERAGEVWECHQQLSNFDAHGDEVRALNAYAASKIAVLHYLEHTEGIDGGGISTVLESVKSQVREVLQDQVESVVTLANDVPQIRRGAWTTTASGPH